MIGSRPRTSHLILSAVLYAFIGLFLIWPIVQIVAAGFRGRDGGFTFTYVAMVFQDRVLLRGLGNATAVALWVTLVSLILALPLAILSVRYDFRGRTVLSGLLLVPLVLPPFVGAVGMRQVFARYGLLSSMLGTSDKTGIDWLGNSSWQLAGIVLVEALHFYPILLLNLQASLANIDPAMEQAAANLGASRWRIFRRITLPLIRPGLFAGCTLVMIGAFTELGTPFMFDFYTITPVQVFKQITDVADSPLPYALVVVTLIVSSLLYIVGKFLLGRGFDAATTKAATAATARKLAGAPAFWAAAAFAGVFALAVLPHVSVVLTSLSEVGAWYKTILPADWTISHFKAALVDEVAYTGMKRSLQYASLATLLAMGLGLAAAIVIVRSDVPGRGVLDTLLMLPLAVPGLVLAFGYLAISVWFRKLMPQATREGGWLVWLNVQENPAVLLIIAYAARRLPYVVRSAVAGLQQTPRDLELAAENLGAPRRTVLRRITIPLITANLIAGGLLAFSFAMLEVSDSLILAQRAQYFPITKAIVELTQKLVDGIYIASALGVWAMALLTLTILSANAFLGKKLGAIFRV